MIPPSVSTPSTSRTSISIRAHRAARSGGTGEWLINTSGYFQLALQAGEDSRRETEPALFYQVAIPYDRAGCKAVYVNPIKADHSAPHLPDDEERGGVVPRLQGRVKVQVRPPAGDLTHAEHSTPSH